MTRFAALALWTCLSGFAVASAAVVSNTVPPSNCSVPAYNISADHAHIELFVTRVESFEGHCSNDRILCAFLPYHLSSQQSVMSPRTVAPLINAAEHSSILDAVCNTHLAALLFAYPSAINQPVNLTQTLSPISSFKLRRSLLR